MRGIPPENGGGSGGDADPSLRGLTLIRNRLGSRASQRVQHRDVGGIVEVEVGLVGVVLEAEQDEAGECLIFRLPNSISPCQLKEGHKMMNLV